MAARDPSVPWAVKLIVVFIVAYALSPIDLIPDFIPVIGYLDDLIILPLAIALAIRLIPTHILTQYRAKLAGQQTAHPKSKSGAVIVLTMWIISAAILIWWLLPQPQCTLCAQTYESLTINVHTLKGARLERFTESFTGELNGWDVRKLTALDHV